MIPNTDSTRAKSPRIGSGGCPDLEINWGWLYQLLLLLLLLLLLQLLLLQLLLVLVLKLLLLVQKLLRAALGHGHGGRGGVQRQWLRSSGARPAAARRTRSCLRLIPVLLLLQAPR